MVSSIKDERPSVKTGIEKNVGLEQRKIALASLFTERMTQPEEAF
jgi:hypothetical protein